MRRYALPNRRACREDFEWILREIRDGGGEALLCETALVQGLDDAGLRALFRDARNADFKALAEEAEELLGAADTARGKATAALGRLEKKLAAIRRLDFFDAPSGAEAQQAVNRLKARLRAESRPGKRGTEGSNLRSRTWVTRSGVEEDRIASAWLIRRFIDPAAEFRFVSEAEEAREGELRFDMFGGEFTHEGDRCTFEVLAERFAPEDEALAALGEIVHEIDLADEKFSRPETAGVEKLIRGVVELESGDGDRLGRGAPLFEALYVALGGTGGTPGAQ